MLEPALEVLPEQVAVGHAPDLEPSSVKSIYSMCLGEVNSQEQLVFEEDPSCSTNRNLDQLNAQLSDWLYHGLTTDDMQHLNAHDTSLSAEIAARCKMQEPVLAESVPFMANAETRWNIATSLFKLEDYIRWRERRDYDSDKAEEAVEPRFLYGRMVLTGSVWCYVDDDDGDDDEDA